MTQSVNTGHDDSAYRPDLPKDNQGDVVSSLNSSAAPQRNSRTTAPIEIHPVIRQIIDRDCHVGTSNKDVVRHVISKLKHGLQTFRTMTESDRQQLIEQCLAQHQGNLLLYLDVMVGPQSRPVKPVQAALPPATLSGRDLIRLMRQYRVTIADLAIRIGVTQRRVRELRQAGIDNPWVIRDWIEAITGQDPGPVPERIRINGIREEAECCFCGYPLYNGDEAWDFQNEVFCSVRCCHRSRH